MNLAALKTSLGQNKTALGIGGAVVVAALALRARAKKSASSSTSSTASDPSGASAAPSYYTAGNPAATGYDSTASDVYNALQPQIEQLNQTAADLRSTIPVPAAPVDTAMADKLAAANRALVAADPLLLATWSTGDPVSKLQSGLGLSPTGTYDTSTVTAVKAFQQKNNMPQTGLVDLATGDRLRQNGVTFD